MRAVTQKLTTAAVCTALSVIMCAMCAYLPLSFMPLYLAAFCIFLACKRAGLPYGLLCAAASIGIFFAMTGLSVKWFLLALMFAPYGLLCACVARFSYFKWKSALIRTAIMTVFFPLTFGFVYLIAIFVSAVGLDIPVTDYASAVGGFWTLAAIVTAILLPLDFIFDVMSIVVLKRIPMPKQSPKKKTEKKNVNPTDRTPVADDADHTDNDDAFRNDQ